MAENITVQVHVRTDLVNSQVETTFTIDKDDWEEYEECDKQEICKDYMYALIEWGYKVI